MKKIIIILFGLTLIYAFNSNNKEEILIPNNAIRFRVIANSNNIKDTKEKEIIKNDIEKKVYDLIKDSNNDLEIKTTLKNNLNKIKEILDTYNINYDINYGLNYFPVKHYKGVLYPAGNYESLVITLGEGLGDNFWCVLFPPLCLLDEEKENIGEVEYKFYVKKLIDKF